MADESDVRILVIDDLKSHAEATAEALSVVGYRCAWATSGEEGLALLDGGDFDIVVTDLVMRGMSGMEVLARVKERVPEVEVIMVTGYSTVESAVEAVQQGAAHYLRKPVNIQELRAVVAKAVEKQSLVRMNIELKRELDQRYGFEGIVGNSPAMKPVFERMNQVAPTNSRVLISGESGTGKELIAKAIHQISPRKPRSFVPLNCAALSEGVLESELFGHEKGAFTGALAARKGRFEFAHRGTLFLDEVGEMPPATQVKLLRVIEEGEIYRVGSSTPIRVDVRLIAATNKKLEPLVEEGGFREDLYFRLNVVRIDLPPLRDRPSDIPLLVNAFIQDLSKVHDRKITSVDLEARKILQTYPWPGNVRELKNCIENIIVLSQGETIGPDDLPESIAKRKPSAKGLEGLAGLSLDEIEKIAILQTLNLVEGNREKAANLLKIGERTLYRKIKQYGLK
ncbi:MAG: sigma-54-dependent transcriptional regulator [Planctomycetota bacterium]|jgi:two-component system response regulator HydG